MKKNIILYILITGALQFGYSQEYQKEIDSIINIKISSSVQKNQIESLLKNIIDEKKQPLYYYTALSFYRKNHLQESLYFGESNVKLASKNKSKDLYLFRKSLNLLGFLYMKNGDIENSERKFHEIINQNIQDRYTGLAYYRLGLIYKESGDFHKAIDYAKKSLEFFIEKKDKKKILDSAIIIGNTIKLLESKEQIDQGVIILERLIQSALIETENMIFVHHLLGNLYNSEKYEQKEKALKNYFKALEIAEYTENFYSYVSLHNSIGNIYLKHDLKRALMFLEKGYKLAKDSTQKGWFSHNFAIYHFKRKNYKESIQFLKQSIKYYLKTDSVDVLENIPDSRFFSSQNKYYVLDAFIFLIEYQNHYRKNKEELGIIYKHIAIADRLAEHIRFESDDQQSKLYWQKQASKLYQQAIKTAFLSNDPEKAFYFMEKNKAVLLLEDITDRELKENADLPENILSRESFLKNKTYYLQDEFNKNQHTKDSLAKEISLAKIQYYNFVDSLKIDYPQYYNYKKPSKTISLTKVQSVLKGDEVIVEYLLNEDQGYGLLIDKENVELFELKQVKQLNTKIAAFKSKISAPFVTSSEIDEYHTLAYELYQSLFPFDQKTTDLANKKVTIVPDYSLQNFPFEALLTKDKKEGSPTPYLIYTSEISYAYSISFLKENQQIPRNHTITYSGFAPVQFGYDKLNNLYRSKQEVGEANSLFSGNVYLNIEATKDSFYQNTIDSKIIHLSTHANATDSITPWIAFKNKKLTLNELYTTKNNAELVVLSACNSSQGELKAGEGVMSLSRGFFYAGANSVISSIWNVDDKSGKYITTDFYKNLKKGKTKSESLRQAKLNYLRNHSLSETSPYYWSSLILIGDPGSIDFPSQHWIWWGIGILVVMSVVFMIRLKK